MFDVPDAFATAAAAAKDGDIVGVSLGMVAKDEAEECGFAGAVRAEQRPAFVRTNGPVQVVKDSGATVTDVDIAQNDERAKGTGGALE